MPSSTIGTFTDPDAYHAAIRNAEVEGIVTARGEYRAELSRIDLHRIWMQRAVESLPRIVIAKRSDWRTTVLFVTDERQPPLQVRGIELTYGEILVLGSRSADHQRTSAASKWGVMSMPVEDLEAAGLAIVGQALKPSPLTYRLRPPPMVISRLLDLHEAAGQLSKNAPDILVKEEVAQAIEQGLVHAMVTCMTSSGIAPHQSVNLRHTKVLGRLEEALFANSDRALYLADLCAATGASASTLRNCCQEHLGMSPMKYLRLRRMNFARRALRMGDPATTTVTEIATDYGFWELGRFSVSYQALFGETPSASLRRPAEDLRPGQSSGSPWEFAKNA